MIPNWKMKILFSRTCNYVYTHFCYETMLENIIIDKKKYCLVIKVQFLLLYLYQNMCDVDMKKCSRSATFISMKYRGRKIRYTYNE